MTLEDAIRGLTARIVGMVVIGAAILAIIAMSGVPGWAKVTFIIALALVDVLHWASPLLDGQW